MLALLTRLFPLWAILLSVAAYYTPTTFTGIGPYVSPLLMLIMFAMGVTLRLDDFKRVLARPGPVAAGIFLHYLIMPLAAWILAMLFRMPPDLSAGMVLVGSVASGTASNVMIYLAKGDVALSVTISAVSTLVGVFATPLQALAQGLRAPGDVSAAVAAVLSLGHFSGADTLLGVWLGVTTINALCGARCEHEGRIADPAGTV